MKMPVEFGKLVLAEGIPERRTFPVCISPVKQQENCVLN